MKKLGKMLLFLTLLGCVFGFFYYAIYHAKSHILPSALIGEEVPAFKLKNLFANQDDFDSSVLKGKVSLLNVWASWCYACKLEHEMLLKIANKYRIPIYGINYKDNNAAAITLLEEQGNPFVIVGSDTDGNVAIDLGIYGTPETFVINRKGAIIYRYVGQINQSAWDEDIFPVIKKAQEEPS